MNESELIDDLKPIAPKSTDHSVRIVVSILSVSIIVLAAFCYMDILWCFKKYAEVRGRVLIGAESLHGMVSAFFTASIPAIAYNCRNKKAIDYTPVTYLIPLVFATVLFIVFLVLGMELLLVISPELSNLLIPQRIVAPPFSFFFDLLFIFAALISFLTLKLVFRKKKRKSIH
ncbi:MAG: hypothetical protein K0S23_432 [Fluviicola sp.]|jgi:hypothetical protein|uniref:hypothetical protein n=1 Tax=Fluviicola sp. TaxID=1917219 RepID=UPI002637A86C|nr:hypothetical protein [Fluviicola sp.]MDF3026125.1 hypothetical protein [Fluviicola sp.]